MKICIVLGTRPEIIKFSPIIRDLDQTKLDYFILHTGQHYSYNMDRAFFEELDLPDVKYNIDVGSGSHGEQTGKMIVGIERILINEVPQVVLVEGDTNTVLAGALAAAKLNIRVGHVEAGLRSYDRQMPEEINRVLTDHCSELLFAPTNNAKSILLGEGIPEKKIYVTGNTIVDAVYQNLKISRKKLKVLKRLGIESDGYLLVTVHREENVDNGTRFRRILKGLQIIHEKLNLVVVYPIHPRAKKQLELMSLNIEGINLVEPLDYLSFLQLEKNARLVLTDSGGVQEESCILRVPCVTLRDNTERPETLEVGSNMLAGTNPDRIVKSVESMLQVRKGWRNPFGDGKAGHRIVRILREKLV